MSAATGIVEDSTRRRCVSISSCDSDPLAYRHVARGGSRAGSECSGHSSFFDGVCHSSSDSMEPFGSDAEGPEPQPNIDGGLALAEVPASRASPSCRAQSGRSTGTNRRRPRVLDIEETDLVPLQQVPSAARDAVPVAHVSPQPFATVGSVIPRSATIVAAHAPGGLLLDAGTTVCLADGTLVGRIATVLGQVTQCSYAIAGTPGRFAELLMRGREAEAAHNHQADDGGVMDTTAEDDPDVIRHQFLALTPLAIGTFLHFDTEGADIIYDPSAILDAREATDASFVQDEELPAHARPDFSDDEKEREWRRAARERRRGASAAPTSEAPEPMEAISSSESEAEFDDDGQMIAYRGRKRAPHPASAKPAATTAHPAKMVRVEAPAARAAHHQGHGTNGGRAAGGPRPTAGRGAVPARPTAAVGAGESLFPVPDPVPAPQRNMPPPRQRQNRLLPPGF